jgi:hypothetical protein
MYDVLYRFHNYPDHEVILHKYRVIKRTPCGAWIREREWHEGKGKFVNLNAKKQFACNTEEEALKSFLRRKRCEMAWNELRMNTAESAIRYAETHYGRNQTANDPVQRVWESPTTDISF